MHQSYVPRQQQAAKGQARLSFPPQPSYGAYESAAYEFGGEHSWLLALSGFLILTVNRTSSFP